MEQLWQTLEGGRLVDGGYTPQEVVLSLLLAFLCGQVLAWVYYGTHSGMSYSRSFVQSLILITVVVAMVMAVIGSSIITALGLMGALAIIRFRNIIKDTRDIAFIFCALVVGMAAGSQRFAIAVVGTVLLCLIVLYLHVTGFGTHQPHNAFLRFQGVTADQTHGQVAAVLKQFCSSFTLISVQNVAAAEKAEYAYQLMVRNANRNADMLVSLGAVSGIEQVALTMQEQLLEV